MMRKCFSVACCIAGILMPGCSDSGRTADSGPVYVVVNDDSLTEQELLDLFPKDVFDKLSLENKKAIVRDWVETELLYQEAKKRGIDHDPSIQRLIMSTEKTLLSNEILEQEYARIPAPDDDMLRTYYEENGDYFILQDTAYSIRYAQFDSRDEARNFWREIKDGTTFSDLAVDRSLHQSSQKGGVLGIVTQDMVEPAVWSAIEKTVDRLGLVKISDPFEVSEGWACIIVDEIYEAGSIQPFESVREKVQDMYVLEQREKVRRDFIHKLSVNSRIEYFQSMGDR